MVFWNNTTSYEAGERTELHLGWFSILCIVSLVGTIGNVFIIGAVCLQKRLRVRGNAFIVNLAVADLIITAYLMPMGLATSRYEQRPFGDALCDFNGFLIMCSCGVSTQTLMTISFERYVTICKTHWYRRIFSVKLIALYITLVWVYSGIWTAQGWTGWTKYVYGEKIFLCIFSGSVSLSYDICLALFGMILPMIVLTFCYVNVFRVVWKSRAALVKHKSNPKSDGKSPKYFGTLEQRRMKREMRLAMTLFTIVVVFTLCWILTAITLPLSALLPDIPKVVYKVSIWIALCNSCANSIIYGVMNKNFRTGYKLFFCKLFCVRSCDRCQKTACRWLDKASSSGDYTPTTNSANKSTSPDTSVTQASPVRRYSAGTRPRSAQKHRKSSGAKVKGESTSTDNVTSVSQTLDINENGTPVKSHFMQYLHLADGEDVDFYSSPILGATIIRGSGGIETRL